MLVVAFFFVVVAFVVVMTLFFMLFVAFFFVVVAFVVVMTFIIAMITKDRALPIGKYQHTIYFRQIQGIGRGGHCFKQRFHPRRHIVPQIDHKVRFLQCFSF